MVVLTVESGRRSVIDIVKRLERLGFTSYEAKAYYALLRKQPANGYEISKLSQVPPSKIYETLQKLKGRGAVIDSQSQPALYLPVEPAVLLRRIQTDTEKTIDSLVDDLSDIAPAPNFQVTWNLDGTAGIQEKLRQLIEGSAHSIYASLWPEQVAELNPALAAAMARSVHVVAATFGPCQVQAQESYNLASCAANIVARTKARLCTVVIDDKDVVIGELAEAETTSKGIWSQTRSVVLVAKEYVRHDIMAGILSEQLGQAAYATLIEQHPLWRK